MIRMIRRLGVFVGFLLVLVFGAGGTLATAGERTIVDAILVRVNDRIMTVSDFKARIEADMSQLQAIPEGEDLRSFVTQIFDAAVDEMVMLERAREKNLTIENERLDQAIDELRQENNLQDDEDFRLAMEQAGMTEKSLRERYRQNMLLQRTIQSELNPTEITTEELRILYEEEKERFRVPKKVELEQIFFQLNKDDNPAELERRVTALIERVRGGSDLVAEATLAGVEVANIGAIPEDDLRPELKTVLDNLDDGDLSEPMETEGGFLVVRLLDRIGAGFEPFEDVKEQLRRRESGKAYQEQSGGLVTKLKAEYLVEIHRERLALLFDGDNNVE
jgi:parvulin-like peptidyl-prolyl isomerase